MKIPKITVRQFAILNVLCPSAWVRIILDEDDMKRNKWHCGDDVRKKLKWNQSMANWFQNMSKLEELKFVKGRYIRQKTSDGGVCRAREYSLTTKGKKAIDEFFAFCDYYGRKLHSPWDD